MYLEIFFIKSKYNKVIYKFKYNKTVLKMSIYTFTFDRLFHLVHWF
jgi:hypothetical protein